MTVRLVRLGLVSEVFSACVTVLTDGRADFWGCGVRVDGLLFEILRALPHSLDHVFEHLLGVLGVDDGCGR